MKDFDAFLDKYHRSLDDFTRGDSKPLQNLYSRKEDTTLANPFGGIISGWESVKKAVEQAATFYREGWFSSENIVKNESQELAYLV